MKKYTDSAFDPFIIAGASILAFFVALIWTYLLLVKTDGLSRNVFAQTSGNCFNPPDAKDESAPFGDDFDPDLPENFIITSVYIKSGDNCFGPYTEDGTYEDDLNGENNCYNVSGIGTGNLSVTRDGEGEEQVCQAVSHIEVLWETEGLPSNTPSPSPAVSESPTPTVTPTPDPSPTIPDPSPTPQISVTESPTPTITPTAVPTESVTPTLTPTPVPGNSATPTPTPGGQVAGTSATGTSASDPNNRVGQVLGASTLAATGYSGNLFIISGLILLIISFYSLKNFQKVSGV